MTIDRPGSQMPMLSAAERSAMERQREELAKRFVKVVGSEYNRVPEKYEFESKKVKGVKVTLYNVKLVSGDTGLYANVNFPIAGTNKVRDRVTGELKEVQKTSNFTVAIARDGSFSFPRESEVYAKVKVFPNVLIKEIIDNIELSGLSFWTKAPLGKLLADEKFGTEGPGGSSDFVSVEDPERMSLLINNSSTVGGLYDDTEGMKGYRVIFLRNAFILENPKTGNAAYIFETGLITRKARLSDEEKIRLLDLIKDVIDNKTRQQWRIEGKAKQFVHKGEWQERMKAIIADLDKKAEERNDEEPLLEV